MHNFVLRQYQYGNISKENVKSYVPKYITAEQYKQITGEEYK